MIFPFRFWSWVFGLFRWKNPVYETMTCEMYCGWCIRVWREEPELTRGPDPEVRAVILSRFNPENPKTVVAALAKLPRIAAIEVLDPKRNGGLFYPDWK